MKYYSFRGSDLQDSDLKEVHVILASDDEPKKVFTGIATIDFNVVS